VKGRRRGYGTGSRAIWYDRIFTTRSLGSAFCTTLKSFSHNLLPAGAEPFNRGYTAAVLRQFPAQAISVFSVPS